MQENSRCVLKRTGQESLAAGALDEKEVDIYCAWCPGLMRCAQGKHGKKRHRHPDLGRLG